MKIADVQLNRVTLQTVADRAKVSLAAASVALRGGSKRSIRVSPAVVQRIKSVAHQLDYRPNAMARSVRNCRSQLIGALIYNAPAKRFHNLPGYEMILGINERLEQNGFLSCLIRTTDLLADGKSHDSRVFREHLLDGVIVISHHTQELKQHVRDQFSRVVWLDANVWEPRGCLRRDEENAGQVALEQLAKAGWRRLCWVRYPISGNPHYSMTERCRGVLNAAERLRVELDQHEVISMTQDFCADMLSRMRQATGFVVYNTQIAQFLANLAAAHGLRIGVDFGLACCDDSVETSTSWPDLSHVTNDRFTMGVEAAQMILQMIEQPGADCSSRLFRGQWHAGLTAGLATPPTHQASAVGIS